MAGRLGRQAGRQEELLSGERNRGRGRGRGRGMDMEACVSVVLGWNRKIGAPRAETVLNGVKGNSKGPWRWMD